MAFVEGFSLHAATRVPASDRRGLWRLCAYGARGALALSRLSELPDGRFAWDMKRPLPDGRSRLVMTGVELIERLVPLIPPVYANLTPCAAVRRRTKKHPWRVRADEPPAREGRPVIGHRDVKHALVEARGLTLQGEGTVCPGDAAFELLPALRLFSEPRSMSSSSRLSLAPSSAAGVGVVAATRRPAR